MSDNQMTRRKSMIRSVIVFLLSPVAASIALIVGVLHMATYVGPDLRQFDPETEMGLRVFGLAVLGIVGIYLAGRRSAAARDKRQAEERTGHA